jgi:cytochrome oxidase Cu insertion factor (SCO1/SenC/PrrC family)
VAERVTDSNTPGLEPSAKQIAGGVCVKDETLKDHAAPVATPDPSTGPSISLRPVGLVVLVVVAVSAVGGLLGAFVGRGGTGRSTRTTVAARPARSSPGDLAAFMGLVRLDGRPAPTFALINQHGRSVSLGELRGKVVVLTFLDDRCGAQCPVLAEELLGAYADLGRAAARVVFLAVNVDLTHVSPTDLLAYSASYGLSSIASWTFLTGDSARLGIVWKAYGISVGPGPAGTTSSTGALFFITPTGDEAFEATPYANQLANGRATQPVASIRRWSAGIAEYAKALMSAGPQR